MILGCVNSKQRGLLAFCVGFLFLIPLITTLLAEVLLPKSYAGYKCLIIIMHKLKVVTLTRATTFTRLQCPKLFNNSRLRSSNYRRVLIMPSLSFMVWPLCYVSFHFACRFLTLSVCMQLLQRSFQLFPCDRFGHIKAELLIVTRNTVE